MKLVKNFITLLLLTLSLTFATSGCKYVTTEKALIEVTDKERIQSGGPSDSFYTVSTRVHLADSTSYTEVFQNTDSNFFWKFNSSDVQAELEVGERYVVEVSGYRRPFISEYRNIVKIVRKE